VDGKEKDVNAITKGKFQLEFEGIGGHPTYHGIGLCSLLLVFQFLFQLLLIPQGSLFGQIMFVSSLGVSWAYNSYLSSLEKYKIQASVLFKKLERHTMKTYRLGTRTSMAVFACLLLCHGEDHANVNPEEILLEFLPNTPLWEKWRGKVIQQMSDEFSPFLTFLELQEDMADSDVVLLGELLRDAKSAFKGYSKHFGNAEA